MDVIFDLDGTLCDCSQRLHYVVSKPKKWKKFFEEIPNDELMYDTYGLLIDEVAAGNKIIICTARPISTLDDTVNWLKKFGIWEHVSKLYMRKNGDFRPDFETKSDLLDDMKKDGFDPVKVFDDRDNVLNMFANKGLQVHKVYNYEKNI